MPSCPEPDGVGLPTPRACGSPSAQGGLAGLCLVRVVAPPIAVLTNPSSKRIWVTDQPAGEARITSSFRVAEFSGKTRKEIGATAAHRNNADLRIITIPLTPAELTSTAWGDVSFFAWSGRTLRWQGVRCAMSARR
jgi:hypothetical protein